MGRQNQGLRKLPRNRFERMPTMIQISESTWRMSGREWQEVQAQGYLKYGNILIARWRLCAVQYAAGQWEIWICKS